MTKTGKENIPQLIKVLEFFDNSGNTLVKRVPEFDNTEIKWGAQLTVRESQIAIFFKDGKAIETFKPGRYILDTKNIPVLTKLVTGLINKLVCRNSNLLICGLMHIIFNQI